MPPGYHISWDVSWAGLPGRTYHRGAIWAPLRENCSCIEDFAMNRFDFTPYRRNTVGFDRLFDLLETRIAPPVATITPPSISSAGAMTPIGSRWPSPASSPPISTLPHSKTCWSSKAARARKPQLTVNISTSASPSAALNAALNWPISCGSMPPIWKTAC